MILNLKNKKSLEFINNFNLFQKQPNNKNLIKLKKNFNQIVNDYLKKKNYFLIIRKFEKNKIILEKKIKLFEKFTTLLEQNEKGIKIVKVSPKKTYCQNSEILKKKI